MLTPLLHLRRRTGTPPPTGREFLIGLAIAAAIIVVAIAAIGSPK